MYFFIKKIIFVLFFIFLNFLNGKSFEASTLVLTLNGYVQIKDIMPCDYVISDNGDFHFANTRVIATIEKKVKSYLKIKISDEIIKTTEDEDFSIGNNNWKKAKNLQIGDLIEFNIGSFLKVESIEKVDEEAIFYSLTLRENHNFYVSKKNIKVHNWFFSVILEFAFSSISDIAFVCVKAIFQAAFIFLVAAIDNYMRKSVSVGNENFALQVYETPGFGSGIDPEYYEFLKHEEMRNAIVKHYQEDKMFHPDRYSNQNSYENIDLIETIQNNKIEKKEEPKIIIQKINNDLFDSEVEYKRLKNENNEVEKTKNEIINIQNIDEKILIDKSFLIEISKNKIYEMPNDLKIEKNKHHFSFVNINENYLKNITGYKKGEDSKKEIVLKYGKSILEGAWIGSSEAVSEAITDPKNTILNLYFGQYLFGLQLVKIGGNFLKIGYNSLKDFKNGKKEFFEYVEPVNNLVNVFIGDLKNSEKIKIGTSLVFSIIANNKIYSGLNKLSNSLKDVALSKIYTQKLQTNIGEIEVSTVCNKNENLNNKNNNHTKDPVKAAAKNAEKAARIKPESMDPNGPKLKLTNKIKMETLNDGTKGNNLEHTFGKIKHKMNPVIAFVNNIDINQLEYLQNIDKSEILNIYYKKTLIEILNVADNKFPINGIFEAKDEVFVILHGFEITLTGRVVNGIPKIGTLYIK